MRECLQLPSRLLCLFWFTISGPNNLFHIRPVLQDTPMPLKFLRCKHIKSWEVWIGIKQDANTNWILFFKTCGGSKNLQRFVQEFFHWFWQNAQLSHNTWDVQKGIFCDYSMKYTELISHLALYATLSKSRGLDLIVLLNDRIIMLLVPLSLFLFFQFYIVDAGKQPLW